MIRVCAGADSKDPAPPKRTKAMETVVSEVMPYRRRLPNSMDKSDTKNRATSPVFFYARKSSPPIITYSFRRTKIRHISMWNSLAVTSTGGFL